MFATVVKLFITTLVSQFVKAICYKLNDIIFRNNNNNNREYQRFNYNYSQNGYIQAQA